MAWFVGFIALMLASGAWLVYGDIQARRNAYAELEKEDSR